MHTRKHSKQRVHIQSGCNDADMQPLNAVLS